MKYDNDRDRLKYGFDAGSIVDGVVKLDFDKNEYVIVDDEGVAFSVQELLKLLVNKKIRFTCVTFESIETIQNMMSAANLKDPNAN
jgi:hypothetical protein